MKRQCEYILITGATGFLGKAVIRYLDTWNRSTSKTKYHVIVATRDIEKAKNKLLRLIDIQFISFFQYENSDTIDYLGSVDWIICAAAVTNKADIIGKPVETFKKNVCGTINCLEYAKKSGIKGMIYLSSAAVYGKSFQKKISECDIGTVDYVHDAYASSKMAGEQLCNSYFKEYGVPVKIARIFQVYGNEDYERGTFLSDCVKAVVTDRPVVIMSDGKNIRNLLHVDDAASAIMSILLNGKSGETYNVGSLKNNYSFLDIARSIIDIEEQPRERIVVKGLSAGEMDRQEPKIEKLLKLGWKENKDDFLIEIKKIMDKAKER